MNELARIHEGKVALILNTPTFVELYLLGLGIMSYV